MEADALYIFLHTHKCAGSTIKEHIKRTHRDRSCGFYRHTLDLPVKVMGNRIDKSHARDFVLAMSPEKRARMKVLFGHFVYYGIHELFGREARYFTFLRHPVSRMISMYNFLLSQSEESQRLRKIISDDGTVKPFYDWIEAFHPNSMTGFLYHQLTGDAFQFPETVTRDELKLVKEELSRFHFVGIVENQDDLPWVYRELGITKRFPDLNVSKKVVRMEDDADMTRRVLERHELDLELYEFAVRLNRTLKSSGVWRLPDPAAPSEPAVWESTGPQ